jgi:hypothetical protein
VGAPTASSPGAREHADGVHLVGAAGQEPRLVVGEEQHGLPAEPVRARRSRDAGDGVRCRTGAKGEVDAVTDADAGAPGQIGVEHHLVDPAGRVSCAQAERGQGRRAPALPDRRSAHRHQVDRDTDVADRTVHIGHRGDLADHLRRKRHPLTEVRVDVLIERKCLRPPTTTAAAA